VKHADNIALGMRPLDDPRERAKVCVRCHVGGKDRVATHAMMAAGHPRLRFELDTYTELWRTSGGREHFRRDADYAARKSAASGRSVWIAGLIETARQRLDLIAAAQRRAAVPWPEFANFNCYSCHRDMRVSEWSAAAGGSVPGQLRFDDSALRVLAAAFTGIGAPLGAKLRAATDAWQRAAAEPAALEAAQTALRAALDEAASGAAAVAAGGPARAAGILEALIDAANAGQFPDYAAAEQAAMAMALLLAEQDVNVRRRADIDALFDALAEDHRFDPRLFRDRFKAVTPTSRRLNQPEQRVDGFYTGYTHKILNRGA
ncbi:MAG: hypothetical protein NZM12_13605, partial [Steroidobacteraceae bacterium]|nr:hypothetical protein [Steroidobacteraceae bacterium]